MPCGPDMAYKPATSACPRTCLNVDDDDYECPLPDIEGCECAAGMVFSGDKCVPKNNCGCMKDMIYFAVSPT